MSAPPFHHSHQVLYADCTAGNHVYYSRYLDFLEAARGEFFRTLGTSLLQWQEHDAVFPVVECRLRYRAPARYDDVLAIELWPSLAEKVRLNFAYRIINQKNRLIAEAETFHVCTNLAEKPRRIPEEMLAVLTPRLAPPPAFC